jgi:hypothetical protein
MSPVATPGGRCGGHRPRNDVLGGPVGHLRGEPERAAVGIVGAHRSDEAPVTVEHVSMRVAPGLRVLAELDVGRYLEDAPRGHEPG